MVQKSVFVEGIFTLRNLRSAGTAAVIEILIASGIAAVLVWHQLQPPPAIPRQPPGPVVDFQPQIPPVLEKSTPVPQPMQQHEDLSQVQPIPTNLPDERTQPVQAPHPPVAQDVHDPVDIGISFEAAMLAAINAQKVYPKISVVKGETGETVVSFDYVNGVVSNIHVDKSSGSRELDQAAVAAVQKAVLPPKPAEFTGLKHFVFTLVFSLGG